MTTTECDTCPLWAYQLTVTCLLSCCSLMLENEHIDHVCLLYSTLLFGTLQPQEALHWSSWMSRLKANTRDQLEQSLEFRGMTGFPTVSTDADRCSKNYFYCSAVSCPCVRPCPCGGLWQNLLFLAEALPEDRRSLKPSSLAGALWFHHISLPSPSSPASSLAGAP